MPDLVCKQDDEFVREKPRWVVTLSNGETIYQDDERPGLDESSAWIRLKRYCTENNLHILEFWLQFRSNRVLVEPKNADGYYFVKGAFALYGDTETYHMYIAGSLQDGRVRGHKWRIPELLITETIDRDVAPDSPCLIIKSELTLG